MHWKLKLCFFLFISVAASAQVNINFNPSSDIPQIFAPGLISTGLNERDFALSPDGLELFYTLQSPQGVFQTILYMKKDSKGKWTKPAIAPFAGRFSDLEPSFSADGKKLFFSSNRPISGNEIKDFDIWVVEKDNNKWGEPKNAGLPVNTPQDEFYPCITNTGNLYFTAAYKNAVGKEDIYFSKWENGKYAEPVPLDTNINSKTYEFNAFVSPGEEFIIFTSYGRKDDKGRGDLYMSVKNRLGKWEPAKNLAFLNSDKLDYCPFVSFDKKTFYFTSERNNLKKSFTENPAKADELIKLFTSYKNGSGDIYFINFEKLNEYAGN
jgi:WD40-like Beta Propeller Repeat